jgi:predicted TIM-barrel fold metal-dependent hydrolase
VISKQENSNMTKLIPGPHPNPSKPRLKAPPRACDSHMHIFGPEAKYPYDPGRNYTPPDALLPTYLALIDRLGIERAVFIQPSVYGVDNSCHFDAMQTMGLDRARGVAVINPEIESRELQRLHDGGFRGARFNVVHTGGSTPLARLADLASRVAEVGWHIQIFMHGTKLPQIADKLMALPGDFVIDHLGNMDYRQGLNQEGFVTLRRLLASGKCWVKLSGAYRFDLDGPPYSKAIPFARALVDTNPERLVWATDWPHPDIPSEKAGQNGPMPDDAILLDALLDWVPDERTRNRVLVDNPQRLYGF